MAAVFNWMSPGLMTNSPGSWRTPEFQVRDQRTDEREQPACDDVDPRQHAHAVRVRVRRRGDPCACAARAERGQGREQSFHRLHLIGLCCGWRASSRRRNGPTMAATWPSSCGHSASRASCRSLAAAAMRDRLRLLDRTAGRTICDIHARELERPPGVGAAVGVELRGMVRKGEQVPFKQLIEPSRAASRCASASADLPCVTSTSARRQRTSGSRLESAGRSSAPASPISPWYA